MGEAVGCGGRGEDGPRLSDRGAGLSRAAWEAMGGVSGSLVSVRHLLLRRPGCRGGPTPQHPAVLLWMISALSL